MDVVYVALSTTVLVPTSHESEKKKMSRSAIYLISRPEVKAGTSRYR
jgi:hypothetical protein